MTLPSRYTGMLVFIAGALIFVSLFLERLGDAWIGYEGSGQSISLVQEFEKGQRLDRLRTGCLERLLEKRKIASGVLRGELTLFEAADHFAQVEKSCNGGVNFRQLMPGTSDQEKLCRQVITWVETTAYLECSAGEAARVRRKLTAQLHEHLNCHGAVNHPRRQRSLRRNKVY